MRGPRGKPCGGWHLAMAATRIKFLPTATETRQQAYRCLNWISPHSFVTFLSEMHPTESGLGVSERRSGSGQSAPLRAMKAYEGVEENSTLGGSVLCGSVSPELFWTV